LNLKETVFLIAALATIGAVVIPAIFDVLQPSEMSPEFHVDVRLPDDASNPIAKLVIKNMGEGQAKNAVVYVLHEDVIQISNMHCPEGKIISNNNDNISKIEFQKLSVNFDCNLNMSSIYDGLVSKVAISADDVEGYQHFITPPLNFTIYEDEVLVKKLNLEREQKEIDEIIELISNQKEKLDYLYLALGSIFTSIFVGIYTFFRSQSISMRIKENEFQSTIKIRESEISLELKNTIDELSNITDNVALEKDPNVLSNVYNKREELLVKISKLSNERDRLRSIMSAKIQTRNLIGEFFEVWVDLEKSIFNMVEKISDIQRIDLPNTLAKNIQALQNRKILDKSTINELHSIRKFRNSLIHGELQPKFDELNQKNLLLKNLLHELEITKIPIQRIISIPKGTSAPGCEECDKCFIPSTLVIEPNEMIVWNNDDVAAHTITSRNSDQGDNDKFDSGLIMSKSSFTHKFETAGEYPYFCMVHPWQMGTIIVKESEK